MIPFLFVAVLLLLAVVGLGGYWLVKLDDVLADMKMWESDMNSQVGRCYDQLNDYTGSIAILRGRVRELEDLNEAAAEFAAEDSAVEQCEIEDDGFITVYSPFFGSMQVFVEPVSPPTYLYQQDSQVEDSVAKVITPSTPPAYNPKHIPCTTQYEAGGRYHGLNRRSDVYYG